MYSPAEQLQTIGLMAAHEAAIAELYRAYGESLPEGRGLFLGLAAEEVNHARLLTGLIAQMRAGQAQVNPGRFSAPSLLASLDLLRERLQEAKKGAVTEQDALATALATEDGLLESRCFEIIEGDAPEVQHLLRTLAADTEAHRERLREACAAAGLGLPAEE